MGASRLPRGKEAVKSPNPRRAPRVCFGAVAKPVGPAVGVCTERQGAREVGPAPAPLCPRVPMESIKAPVEPCVALTPAPWERTRRRARFGSLSSPNLQRAAQNGTMGALGAGDVRGVHIKKGQRMGLWGQRREGEGPPSPTHPAPFSALIAGSESRSQAEVSLGFCWACHWVPLSSTGSMLDSIWPAGPREREEGPAQNPNCVRLSNPLLLSVKGRRIKNSCYIYWGGGGRRGKSHPCL